MNNPQQKTILLVEDDATTMMIETHLLESFGYAVIPAKSGEEAVQIAIGNDKIALILMDVDLGPGIDGPEAARQILGKRKPPIVFLSSHTEKEYVERIKGIAGYGYVVKNSNNVVIRSSIEMAFNLFETQEVLRASEERLRFAMEGANDGLWDVQMQTGEVYLSPRGCEILGYGAEGLSNVIKKWDQLVHPDDLPATNERLQAHLAGRAPIFEVEQRLRTKSGDWKWILARGKVMIRDAQGQPLRMTGTHSDITERKQAEKALRENEARLNKTQEISHLGIGDMDLLTKRLVLSDEVYRIYGLKPQEFAATYALLLNAAHPEDRAALEAEYARSLKEGKTNFEIEHRIIRRDTGEIRYVHERGENVKDASGRIVRSIGMVQDITERKQAEILRAQQLHFVQALNEIAEVIVSKDNSEEILSSAACIIGETLQVDRALIYDVSFEQNKITGLCEWLKQDHPDIAPTRNEYPLAMFLKPFTEIKTTRKHLESQFNAVNEHFIADGSGKILHGQMKIKSLIWYPFAFDDHGYYVFTLNQILSQRQWTPEEIGFLASVSKLVSLALVKIRLLKASKQADAQLRASEAR